VGLVLEHSADVLVVEFDPGLVIESTGHFFFLLLANPEVAEVVAAIESTGVAQYRM